MKYRMCIQLSIFYFSFIDLTCERAFYKFSSPQCGFSIVCFICVNIGQIMKMEQGNHV